MDMSAGPQSAPSAHAAPATIRRHRLSTQLWHWANAVAAIVMLMSGLMISNAHPRLYWGHYGANPDKAWLELPQFPAWMTIPSSYNLADARLWHLAFAWIFGGGLLVYLIWSLVNGHVWRDLRPSRAELSPRHLWHEIRDHAALRLAETPDGARYNVLQKLAYCGVLLVLLPLLVLTGLAMSPAIGAALHGLPDLFGGRQSARSIHFICAGGVALFVIVHLVMVLLSGPVNGVWAMITGHLPPERKAKTDG